MDQDTASADALPHDHGHDHGHERKRSSTSVGIKILVGLGATLALTVVGTCGAGVLWLQSNREALTATAKSAMQEGGAFGDGRDSKACLDEALRRLEGIDDLVAESANKVWLESCLQTAVLASGTCNAVPARDQIMASARWAIDLCQQSGHEGSQACARLVGAVQERCVAPR